MPDLDNLFATYTGKKEREEATAFRTYPTDTYVFRADEKADSTKVYPEGNPESMIEDYKTRPFAHITGLLSKIVKDESTGSEVERKVGLFSVDISWVPVRRTQGKRAGELDAAYQRYEELAKALGTEEKSVGETIAAAFAYPVRLRVREVFVRGEGDEPREYKNAPEKPEDRAALLQDGYRPRNQADRFTKFAK